MRTVFNLLSYGIKRTDNLLFNKLDSGNIRLILGEDADFVEEQFIIDFEAGSSGDLKFELLINSEGHGLTPMILALPSKESIYIGYNSSVAKIDVSNRRIDNVMPLDSLFYRFIQTQTDGIILILCELGIVGISEIGEVLWRFSGDVIEDYELQYDSKIIVLRCMDNSVVRISTVEGKVQ